MIDFKKITPELGPAMIPHLSTKETCEYSFVNLCIWGNQKTALVDGYYTFFSQFNRKAVYLFPVGEGEILPVLDAILADAQQRGIRCCLTGLNQEKCQLLEQLYPDKFRFITARDNFDYLYSIDDLADLKGRKYQKKRNHLHRFHAACPNWSVEPLSCGNMPLVRDMAQQWYRTRIAADPQGDYHLEQQALERALTYFTSLPLEGLVLRDGNRVIAFSMASPISQEIYDVHFEKALDDVEGAYTAINQAFASWLRERHPALRYLNREDDLGLEGLRKAKLSYYPVQLMEKYWARPKEDFND